LDSSGTFYIESENELKRYCAACEGGELLGLDTEFLRERTYYPQACLVQVSGPAGIACVDPLAVTDLAPLRDLLALPVLPKVMHACRQDLEIFQQLFDAVPPAIFDTQLAAAFCGHGDQVSYAALVDALTGIHLPKAHTRARWCERPLKAAEIHYAEDDVRHLPALYRHLAERLAALGREDWFAADMAVLTDPTTLVIDPAIAWQRVGALRNLDGAAYHVACALAGWREATAQRLDRPRNWIVSDAVLVRIAQAMPTNREQLAAIEDVMPGLVNNRGREILAQIEQARENTAPTPTVAQRPSNREKSLQKQLARRLDECAADLGMPASLLATRRDLLALVQGERKLPLLQGWRVEQVGRELLGLLEAA